MQTIGPYQLVQELGQCPVGGVWSAVDAGNNAATVAMLSTAAAHDPGWRNAFAATANSLAQSGEVPVIAGDYSGPTPWIASAARDGSVLGRVFVALGMDYQPVSAAGGAAPAAGAATAGAAAMGAATAAGAAAAGSPQAAPDAADPVSGVPQPVSGSPQPVSGSPQPVSGAPSEPTAPIPASASPYQPADLGYGYGPQQGGSPHTVSPHTVSPFSVPPAAPPRRSRAPLIGIVVLVLVILIGGGGILAFVLWPDDGDPSVQPTTGPPTTAPPLPGLVGQWDFDEGSGETANDASEQGNHARFANGAGWTADGYGGTPALEFGEEAGHLVTDGPVLLSNRSFTVSAWVRLAQEADHHQYVLWQSGTEASAFVLQYRADGLWGFSVTSIEGGEVIWHELSSDISPVLDEWTHIAGVYDRELGEIRVYVNGRFESRGEATAQPSVSGLQFGSSGSGRLFGTVDTVRAYQAALTDEQIAALYEDQHGGP